MVLCFFCNDFGPPSLDTALLPPHNSVQQHVAYLFGMQIFILHLAAMYMKRALRADHSGRCTESPAAIL